jgi:hypothetical protein
MAHAMLALKPSEPDKPHKGPWVYAPGGFALDVDALLYIPSTYARPKTTNFAVTPPQHAGAASRSAAPTRSSNGS